MDAYVYVAADNVPIRVRVSATVPLSHTSRAVGLQLLGSSTITWYAAAAWASGVDTDTTREIEITYGPSGIGALTAGIYAVWARVGASGDARICAIGDGSLGFDRVVVFAA